MIKDKCFLITGGFGLLASHIAGQLLEAGAKRIVLFDNSSIGDKSKVHDLLSHEQVYAVRGDILRVNELYDALDGVDGVFHTAFFITRPLSDNLSTGMDVNVRGMMNLLQACHWRGVPKVVYSSSISVYGSTIDGVITEDMPFQGHGVPPAYALYGSTKVVSEHLLAFYKERFGLDYVALRVSSVYGERQHDRGVAVQIILDAYRKIRDGEPLVISADEHEVHDYVYVGDVARAQLMAMASELSGESINIASGVPTSYGDLLQAVKRACQNEAPVTFIEDPARVRSAKVSRNSFSNEKAKRLLGWSPSVPMAEGIKRLIEWQQRNNQH